ncbi:AAA family ATPase [Mucilaginibacter sp. X4EP1]|uniref:AAA family ATPase n=1 Tax=Mucilaginibacter sp. X4EP1 TaxID=2723092 RepID=UPI00216877DE|nr:ATP-binding protein [Mucilaginibacter sp. X4EP1]MCS3811919.1 SpoVK/Ycf46/Vps4 family AAA+-type ATPase [Mucilaginibacter sp. X4EP1]
MAAADQIKSLIKSFGEDDEERFFSSAIQIAASEARQGHVNIAQELKSLIEQARKTRSNQIFDRNKTVHFSPQKRELSELIDIYQPQITLKDMVLNEHVYSVLNRVIDEQRKSEILRQHNLSPQRKLLLMGPPGCGKTMTAEAIAGELGIPVFIVRLDGIMSKFMGESIVKLRLIFDAMPNQRAVYLFDEFDSIGSHRNMGQDVGEVKRVLNSFLINIEKDQSNSIIIAATNLPESLDKALFRRFDEIINYPVPTVIEIEETLARQTRNFKFDKKPNLKEIAKNALGLNYSEIIKACEETVKYMILSDKKSLSSSLLNQNLQKKKM